MDEHPRAGGRPAGLPPVVIINPNSTEAVTAAMQAAVDPLAREGGPALECVTLEAGPPGIETQVDVDTVVPHLLRYIATHNAHAGAFVIGCYSDPGLHAAREVARCPVFGIAQCALSTALTRGERIGVISILEGSIPRHTRQVRALGLESHLAADLALGLGVVELADHSRALARMTAVATCLRDEHGADVLVMGCAGMARHQRALEAAVGIPVVEPTRAAAAIALGVVT